MKNRAFLHAMLLATLLVLTQALLLFHVSSHELHSNHKTQCELCQAANNLNASLPGDSFEIPIIAIPSTRIVIQVRSILTAFTAKSPLPRSPPFINDLVI